MNIFRGYPKINTCFKRDRDGYIIPDEWSCDAFKYLAGNDWLATEKIDGTNIHIDIEYDIKSKTLDYAIYGRTTKTIIPKALSDNLAKIFNYDTIINYIGSTYDGKSHSLSLYGEGYGYKIQNGHNYIEDDCSFILFDVWKDGLWLDRCSNLLNISGYFGINAVPMFGPISLLDAIDCTSNGFNSYIACTENYKAEGMVLTPVVPLCDSTGERIITKIKHSDFLKLYGKDISNDKTEARS